MKFETYRKKDIEEKLQKADFRPMHLLVTGVTGAGKSTTLNAVFDNTVAEVGRGTDPETMKLKVYKLNNVFQIWDTPGLGDGTERDQQHKRKIINLLSRSISLDGRAYGLIDMVLVIIEGSNRDMGSTYMLLNEVIVPNIQGDRILVVINQADVAMKGRHWDGLSMRPDSQLIDFLEKKSYSVQKRVKEATGISIPKPVYYSAEYGYNIKAVFDFIIDNMPIQRRALIK